MNVLAYCAERWVVSTRMMLLLTGLMPICGNRIRVLTAPPLDAVSFPYKDLDEQDIVYIRLHGLPGQDYLYDDSWQTAFSEEALSLNDVKMKPLSLVFIEGCFGAKTDLPRTFLKCGARFVVASTTKTVNRPFTVGVAGNVGRRVLRAWMNGRPMCDAIVGTSFRIYEGVSENA